MNSAARSLSRLLLVAILAALGAAATLGVILTGKAAVLTALVLIAGVIAVSLVRNLEYVAFVGLAVSLPIRLNMRLSDPLINERANMALGFTIGVTDCLIIVLLINWARRVIFYDQPIRWMPSLTIPMVLLWGWAVQAGARSIEDPYSALWMVMRCGECIALFLYLINNVRPIRDYLAHVLATCGMLLFEAGLGLGQGVTGGFNFGMELLGAPTKRSVEHSGSRITGTMPTPNVFAAMLSMFIVYPIALLFSRNRVPKALVLTVILFTGFAMLGTKSRGVWMSSTIVFGYLIFAMLRTRLSTFRAGFGLFWIVAILGLVAFATPGVIERLTADDKGSAEARPYMNHIAMNMIADKPLFGFGWDNYTLYFQSYDDTDIMHSEAFPFIVHNGYLYTAAEYGIPALVLLLWIWISVLWRTLRWSPQSFSLIGMLAFLFPWAFLARVIQTPLYVNNPLAIIDPWYALAMCLVFRELAEKDLERSRRGLPDPVAELQ